MAENTLERMVHGSGGHPTTVPADAVADSIGRRIAHNAVGARHRQAGIVVELTDAGKPGGGCDIAERQVRGLDQHRAVCMRWARANASGPAYSTNSPTGEW